MCDKPHADLRFNDHRVVILQRDWIAKTDRGGFLLYVLDKRDGLPTIERFDAFDACLRRFDELTSGMTSLPVI